MSDIFNTVETTFKTFYSADNSPLLSLVNTFREKAESELFGYFSWQLPAIAVHSGGMTPAGPRKDNLQMFSEVVAKGGDIRETDRLVKQIAAQTVDYMREHYAKYSGPGFDSVDQVEITGVTINQAAKADNTFIVSAVIEFTATIIG